jgi:hypothetical protein
MVDIETARAQARRGQIRRTLYTVYPRPLGVGLICEDMPADLATTPTELSRPLYYLIDEGQIQHHGAQGHVDLYRLTAAGCDRVEADAEHFGLDRARIVRMLRLRVLQTLDLSRTQPMGLALLGMGMSEDTDLDLSPTSIKRALAYLCEIGLVAAEPGDVWRITAAGIDYLEGDGKKHPGVADPLDWS